MKHLENKLRAKPQMLEDSFELHKKTHNRIQTNMKMGIIENKWQKKSL